MACAIDGDRHAARLPGRRRRAAGRRRRRGDPFRIGRRRRGRRSAGRHRRLGRTGGSGQRPRPAQERQCHAGARQDADRRRQHAPVDGRRGDRDPRFGRRDGAAYARGDRAEGDQGALRGTAGPTQRRSRTVCAGGRQPGHPAAARSDRRRFSRPAGGARLARRRRRGDDDRRRLARTQLRGAGQGDRRPRQRRIRAT